MPPPSLLRGGDTYVQQLTRARVTQALHQQAAVGIARGMAEAMLAMDINNTQLLVARVLAEKKLTAAERRNIHQKAGEAAQRSMIAGYNNRRNRRNTPAYRTTANNPRNVRLAGGILLRALRHPDMIDANADSIRFINAQILDREAAHWRRVNFGAGGAAGTRPGRFGMRWGSLVIGSLGLAEGPSPAFSIPTGRWIGGEFYPTGEGLGMGGRGVDVKRQKRRVTRGIAASQFMDAGVRRLATEIPRGYVGAIERIYKQDRARFAGIARDVEVPIRVFRPPGASAFKARAIRRQPWQS